MYVGYLSLSLSLSLSLLSLFTLLSLSSLSPSLSSLSLLFPLSLQVASHHNDLKLMFVSDTADADNYFVQFFGNIPIFTIPVQIFSFDVLFIFTLSVDYI